LPSFFKSTVTRPSRPVISDVAMAKFVILLRMVEWITVGAADFA